MQEPEQTKAKVGHPCVGIYARARASERASERERERERERE